MVIGISGKLGSGKDTVGIIIQHLICESKGIIVHDYQRLKEAQGKESYTLIEYLQYIPQALKLQSTWEIKKMAGKLKEIASVILGVPVEKFEDRAFKESYLSEEWNYVDKSGFKKQMTVRQFLQKLGTDAMRNGLHPNTWANAFWVDYVDQKPEDRFSNIVYPNWIITDVRFPNEAESVLDHGGILIRVNRDGDTGNHPSETGLDDWEFEYTIDNNGTIEELIEKVRDILIENQIL
jgi:ABC-type oligopeptide transport system ATPase subunit